MKLLFLALVAASAVFLQLSTASALSWEEAVTSEYVRKHPEKISVSVVEKENGLLAFTVALKLEKPHYVVSHMVVRNSEDILAESHTPAYTRPETSRFHFSVPRRLIETSSYTLSVGHFLERPGREPAPMPGSFNYVLKLSDFLPPDVSE